MWAAATTAGPDLDWLCMRLSLCQDSVMRCVAGAGLFVLVGCNQIFGITPTQEYDARPADMPHVVLDWQIASVLASGEPDPVIRFAPIAPAPAVRIAPLDVPFAADPKDDHDRTTYSTGDGWIPIPFDYEKIPWRLQYTLADGVPHEVQWLPESKQGHLTVPVFGRTQRQPVPTGSGYTITPAGVAMYSQPRVVTTGLWTEAKVSNYVPARDGAKIDYDFVNAVSMSGDRGSPDPMLGDQAYLLDYSIDSGTGGTNCRVASGATKLDSAALVPGMHTMSSPMWRMAPVPVMSAPVALSFITRLLMGLGKLEDTFSAANSTLLFGAAASTNMPALTTSPVGSPLGVVFPTPVMTTLLQCLYSVNRLPDAVIPIPPSFPPILHVQLVDSRQTLGVTLNSGMETVITSAAAGGFTMAFPAPLPMAIKLATPTKGMVALDGDSDQVVGPASGPFDLSFEPEMGADLRPDYYDVVLHRIVGGMLTTDRIYTVTAPKVRIDGSLLQSGVDYVLEIRSYKGHPDAQRGNFATVDYPYGSAIVFTRTFRTS